MVCHGLSWSARIFAGYSRLGIHRHPSASNCFFSLLSAPLWGANNFTEKGNEVQIHHDWGLGCKVLGSRRQRGETADLTNPPNPASSRLDDGNSQVGTLDQLQLELYLC